MGLSAVARLASGHSGLNPPVLILSCSGEWSFRQRASMQAKKEERLGNGSKDALRRRGRGTFGGFARLESRVGEVWIGGERRGSIMYNSGCIGSAFAVRY